MLVSELRKGDQILVTPVVRPDRKVIVQIDTIRHDAEPFVRESKNKPEGERIPLGATVMEFAANEYGVVWQWMDKGAHVRQFTKKVIRNGEVIWDEIKDYRP